MTDMTKRMIESYLPNPREPELNDTEYYYMRDDNKVFKVYISEMFSHEDQSLYGCRYSHNGQKVHTCYFWDGIPMRQLYDNKQDCLDHSHLMYDNWEQLRTIQQKESTQ